MDFGAIVLMLFLLIWTGIIFALGCCAGVWLAEHDAYQRGKAEEQDAEIREFRDRYGAAR